MAKVKVKGVVCNCVPGEDIRNEMEELKDREVYHGIAPSTGKPRYTNYFRCNNCGHIVSIVFDVEDPIPRPGMSTSNKRFETGKEIVGGNGETMDRAERRAMRKARRKAQQGTE